MPAFIFPGRSARGLRPNGPPMLNAGSPQTNGLLSWWPFGPPYGQALREMVAGRFGATTNFGASTTSGWVSSPTGGLGLRYDGANDYVAVSAPLVLYNYIQNSMVFSLAFWAQFNALTTRQGVMGNTAVSAERGSCVIYEYGVGAGNGAIRFIAFRGSAGNWVYDARTAGDSIIPDVHPHHVAIVGTGTACEFYVDGVSRSVTTITAFTSLSTGDSTRNLLLGGINAASPPSLPFASTLLDVRIWSRRLSPADVWALYDPATRWDLYWQPGRRVFFDVGAAFDASLFPHLRPLDPVRRLGAMIPSGRVA